MILDPLTAALNLATEIVKLHILIIEKSTPEQQAVRAQMVIDDLKGWRDVIAFFRPRDAQ